jgi:hypothetical protein
MGWAAEEAAKIAEAEDREAKDRAWQLYVNQTVHAEAKPFFDKVAEQIEADVRDFNAARSSNGLRCERDAYSVTVYKEQYPSVRMQIAFNELRHVVTMTRETIEHPLSESASTQNQDLVFTVDGDGGIHLGGTNYQSVARRVLQPVIDTFCPRR